MNDYFISVIIPTYNRAQYVGITINSFLKQTCGPKHMEIILCNNKSTDQTEKVIQKIIQDNQGFSITYLYEERQGVHFARNRAAKASKGNILYFTDDDMVAEPDMLEKLVAVLERYPKVGVVTGRVVPNWEKTPPKWVERYLHNQWLSLIDKNMELCVTEYDCGVYSCHEAIRRQAFMNSGGFNPENTAGEWIGDGETGLNIKISKDGWYFAYVGKAITHHIIPPSRMTQQYLNKRLYNQGCSDSYTDYRRNHIINRPEKYFVNLLFKWMQIVFQWLRGKNTLRFMVSYVYYYKARILYDKRLKIDKDWRGLVERMNWLAKDE